jgi:hypothetical protein
MTNHFRLFAAVLLISIAIGIASGTSEFTQYLGQNVTVNACNLTVYQGVMVAEWPTTIVVQEKCNPEIGNVTIKKSCIIWIRQGYTCLGG